MKRWFGLSASVALLAGTLCAEGVDERVFLAPHLAEVAGQVAFKGGEGLAQDKKGSFAYAVSYNVGVHLPSTTHVVTGEKFQVIGLGAHLKEITESLQPQGKAVITAPASFGVLFTSGARSAEEITKDVAAVLEKIGTEQSSEVIARELGSLTDVMHATFARTEGKLALVTDEKVLHCGQEVWRKTPEGAEQQTYHSEEEYLAEMGAAGLHCEELKRPCFFGEVKWKAYNSSLKEGEVALGDAYKENHPFTVYHVVKKG